MPMMEPLLPSVRAQAEHVDILKAGHLGVEAGADFEQRGNAALILDTTSGRRSNVAKQLQKGTLASSVFANDTKNFALLYLE